jgi:hypothetical protein
LLSSLLLIVQFSRAQRIGLTILAQMTILFFFFFFFFLFAPSSLYFFTGVNFSKATAKKYFQKVKLYLVTNSFSL